MITYYVKFLLKSVYTCMSCTRK